MLSATAVIGLLCVLAALLAAAYFMRALGAGIQAGALLAAAAIGAVIALAGALLN